jgi:hemerythrin
VPRIEWSDDYLTGVPAIDGEHRALFALINDLHDKAFEGFSEKSVKGTIAALVDYVDYHFKGEEGIMETCDYDDIENHKAGHRKLQRQLETYRLSYQDDPGSFDMADFLDFLTYWLKDHILQTDMAYVPYVHGFVDKLVENPSPRED